MVRKTTRLTSCKQHHYVNPTLMLVPAAQVANIVCGHAFCVLEAGQAAPDVCVCGSVDPV